MYVIIFQRFSPIGFYTPKLVGYVNTLKEASKLVKDKNKKSRHNCVYFHKRVKEIK
jgi:hypothetical protein